MDRRDARAVTTRTPIALTIAGSDSGGGAGIQADLKTFAALGVHGASAITALTAQNTRGVSGILAAPPDFVREQIDAVLDDFDVAAIKIGMLASARIAMAVAERLGGSRVDASDERPPRKALVWGKRLEADRLVRRACGAPRSLAKGEREGAVPGLRPGHGRFLGRGARRGGVRCGDQGAAAAFGRLPDPQSRRGRRAARCAARDQRSGDGRSGRGVARVRADAQC